MEQEIQGLVYSGECIQVCLLTSFKYMLHSTSMVLLFSIIPCM